MKIRKIVGDSDEQLLGGNFLNNTSGSYSSLSTFKLETNFTGKINTNYDNVLTSFSNPISLDTIKLNEVDSEMISTDRKVKLNFDKSDLKSYIGFGSVVDYMKSAIHNIILDYPASLYVDSEEFTINPRNTVADYIPNIYLNTSKLKIYSTFIKNKFGLIYNKDNSNIPDDNELRNLNLSYSDYVIYYNNVEYNIISFIGSYNGLVEMEVEGLPFGEDILVLTNRTFHIKPKPLIFNKIRKKMGNLERYFLQNRLLDNSGFQITIKEPFFMDDGRITYQDRILLWSTSDGYNVDYEGGSFNAFVSSLINISENYDNTKTDLINRFLTPPSLKIYDNTQDRKIEKLLRIWGRNFDEVKQYIDALTKINKLSYDKQNNIPDVLVKNLARTFGWDDITLVKDDDIINNFFAVDYEENKTDMLPVEIDIELWRRILINTNFFWKTKGTRQAILAIFKLIGIPEPFVNIKEYIYTVDEVINPDDVDLSLEDLYSSSLPYNKNGYPIAPTETNDFFFQISGNTDNGQHYMNNFRQVGFVLNQIEDNKKSWVYSGETIREHGSTVQYYQESSDLVLNTKQVDISLDIANAVEYDVFDYIKNVDYPNNSPDYAKKFTFINIDTDPNLYDNVNNESKFNLPDIPVGDVQVSLNGITLTNDNDEVPPNIITAISFGTGFGAGATRSLIQDSNNKYVVGGIFNSYDGISVKAIVRLNQDGSIDESFNIGTGFSDGYVLTHIEDSNNKYVVGGGFASYNGTTSNNLIRLNQDGSIDETFNIGTGFEHNQFDSGILSLIQDNNGKYVIGGRFDTYNGISVNCIIRLNQDGSIDETFNIGTGFPTVSGGISKLIQDNNGKYVIGGSFDIYNGISVNSLIRLNQDGSIDETFNTGTGFTTYSNIASVSSLIQDSDNKYLIGGSFTSYNGVSAEHLIRLNQDGSIDNTFDIGIAFYHGIQLIFEDNNKYFIGGSSLFDLIRLNQDGTVDNTFNIGTGFNGGTQITNMIKNTDNDYIVGGQFNNFNNVGISRHIVKLRDLHSNIVLGGDYYLEDNNLIIKTNLIKNGDYKDVITISYLYNNNDNLLQNQIKYVVGRFINYGDGSKIILPDEPNGDVQLTVNGISLTRGDSAISGEYKLNDNNKKEIFIENNILRNMILDNQIIQVSYLTSETGYDLNQKSEFYKINSFNTDKLFFNTQINRFVYKLNIKVNNVNDIRLTLNGITLSPENEYQLSTTDKSNILLPPQIQLGDVLGFYYVKSESGENDLAVPDAFGVGDISKLSFLEFIDLLEKKLINVKNRKVITDNKGGFYPTLLRVYIQYLKRSKLDDDNILQSNGYTYDNLYEFLNKYNSFFYNFTEKLLPATVIHGKSGFLIRNSVFSKQKFTYKRGVGLNIVDGFGVPNTDLNWLGNDGSEFRSLQTTIFNDNITLLIDNTNTYYYENGNCYNIDVVVKTSTNANISNKILINGSFIFEDNSTDSFTIIMDNINTVSKGFFNFENTPKSIRLTSYENQIGEGNYEVDYIIQKINHNNTLDVSPTNSKISIINSTITQKETTGNNLVDVQVVLNNYFVGLEFELKINSNNQDYFMIIPNDFSRSGNIFTKLNHEVDVTNTGTIVLNERIDNNKISCITNYIVDNNETFNYNFIPHIPAPTGDAFIFTIDTTLGVGNSFNLPLRDGYNYDLVVDWGDGNISTVTSWNDVAKLHNYSTGGVYTIKITGLCEAWYFNNGGDKLKITSIDKWWNVGFIDMNSAFSGCANLLTSNDTDGTWCSNVTNMANMFNECSSLTSLNVSNWDVSNVIKIQRMFYGCNELTTLDVANWNTSNVTNTYAENCGIFSRCYKLTNLNVSNWNVGGFTTMNSMFKDCRTITTLDLSSWNVSNVTDMRNMFQGCNNLTTLDLSAWNVPSLSLTSDMFYWCTSLETLNLSNWNAINLEFANNMFERCCKLTTLDISNWITPKLLQIKSIFTYCELLTTIIGIENLDVSNVQNMNSAFSGCKSLTTLDLNNWEISSSNNDFAYIFSGCLNLTNLNISNWDTSNVRNFYNLFNNCQSLTSLNLSNWDVKLIAYEKRTKTPSIRSMEGMFNGCPLNTVSYNNILISWSQQLNPNDDTRMRDIILDAPLCKYSSGAAATAKTTLEATPYNWIINDGGQI